MLVKAVISALSHFPNSDFQRQSNATSRLVLSNRIGFPETEREAHAESPLAAPERMIGKKHHAIQNIALLRLIQVDRNHTHLSYMRLS